MNRKDEIAKLKQDVKKLQKAIVLLDFATPVVNEAEETIEGGIEHQGYQEGLQEAAKDASAAIARTQQTYANAMDYFQRRISILQGLDRQERLKVKPTPTSLPKSKAMATKPQKSKTLKVHFVPTNNANQLQVFVGESYVGTIRKSRTEYQSDTVLDFTEEAKKKRKFTKADGTLDIQEIAKFSKTRQKYWKFGTRSENYATYQEAALALVAQKMPNKKVTL